MRLIKVIALSVMALVSTTSTASTTDNDRALELLQKMHDASGQLSYESSYIRVSNNIIEPLRYRHAQLDKQPFSQLTYLSGPFREVIQRGGEVSYLEPGNEAYTINAKQMVAPLPLLHTDLNLLAQHYNFVPLGRAREAGLSADVVRISPKDGERYSYVLWIDEASKLLLRMDLLDNTGEPIEQIRSLQLTISSGIALSMKDLVKMKLPPAVKSQPRSLDSLSWQVTKLPAGFEEVALNRNRLMSTERPVESVMYSDGLFSFSVYLSNVDGYSLNDQVIRNGRRTLFTKIKNDMEISVIGDIPPQLAEKIANSVQFATETKSPAMLPNAVDVQ